MDEIAVCLFKGPNRWRATGQWCRRDSGGFAAGFPAGGPTGGRAGLRGGPRNRRKAESAREAADVGGQSLESLFSALCFLSEVVGRG